MTDVEVRGGLRFKTWKGRTYTPEIINRALNLPVDVDEILGSFPFLKPPGGDGGKMVYTGNWSMQFLVDTGHFEYILKHYVPLNSGSDYLTVHTSCFKYDTHKLKRLMLIDLEAGVSELKWKHVKEYRIV